MDIDPLTNQIQRIYEECKRERGILLTLPEYRLSFQLKIYDSARKGHYETATNLLKVHNWLNENSRHILDESDAILQPNYQLIYTVGAQLPLDGNELRWTCIQAILKRVPHHMRSLYIRFGDQKIEFAESYTVNRIDYGSGDAHNRPEVFRPCRLLDTDLYDHLKFALAHDFINGELAIQFPEMTEATKTQVYDVLVDKQLGKYCLEACLKQFDPAPQQTILVLSGLLKFEVLRLALTKRWRVNYGRNVNGTRKMAVPYKAKDVAAEMTEFGHPDVAICFTHLSYYYSGLNDVELFDTFRHLDLSENASETYDEWIRLVPPRILHESIKSYSGVNLSDARQRTEYLFPVLRRNMYVIDYWLSNKVFPHEAKMFDAKLMCSAWDLCSHYLVHPVTGFSGTNDTRALLPLPIKQSDLRELEKTNESVRQTLMRAENDRYQALESNITGMAILQRLKANEIPVLIDAGALMLELNNKQVACEWLKLVPGDKYDAAIFFSDADIMLTIDRKDFIIEFEYSVHREQLHRCVVYLDDVHTRGTDLKFPRDIRACVTLCGGITRDKTVQACKRMRMLGEGHQVAFWASHEADVCIRQLSGKSAEARITTEDVINYVVDNSKKFEKEGMSHWLNGAQNYAKKYAAHKYVEEIRIPETPKIDLMHELGQRCADTENLNLVELYGAKGSARLTQVGNNAFNQLKNKYDLQPAIHDWIEKLGQNVNRKLREKARDVVRFTQFLDEEYEKELEYELEQHRQVCRPQAQIPVKPSFHSLLKKFCGRNEGRWKIFDQLKTEKVIISLPFALRNTHLFTAVKTELNAWDKNLWVTDDFRSVIEPNKDVKDDEYLRPVWWIVRVDADTEEQPDTFILISPFEANELKPTFRAPTTTKATLHMFCAKLSQSQNTLINQKALQIPNRPHTHEIPMNTYVQLTVFAGSTYFGSVEEQSAYCNFIGAIPNPRTVDQQMAFETGEIMSSGFVQKRHRHRFPDLEMVCRFEQNPTDTIIKIIERRHGSLPKRSHTRQLLYEGKRARLDNGTDDDDDQQAENE